MKRRIWPPHWVLICLASELALARWFPLASWGGWWRWAAGGAVAALGLVMGGAAIRLFRRKKTGILPFSESTALVVEGPYRFTRNPIYLGMTLLLTGAAIALGAASSFVMVPAFVIVIQTRFIIPEEAHMERALGADYLAFKHRTRRWL